MKKKFYLVLDTETATLPFANTICKNAAEKQKIAISKPLVYDIGWVIMDRQGNIVKETNYLVQETFFVPSVFNTAYYKDKRDIYMELLAQNKILAKKWNDIIKELIFDLQSCDITAAYNACFDFKKAIPFTEEYILNLYNVNYNIWEETQYKNCVAMLKNPAKHNGNPEYLQPYFEIRGKHYPIVDLWSVACEKLINTQKYKDYCLQNSLLTNSAMYFKTSAETSFQYLMKNHDFIEDHTALSDAKIEAAILTKALKKGKVTPQIEAFPFKKLDTPYYYVTNVKPKYKDVVKNALQMYIEANDGEHKAELSSYWKRIINMYENL